MTNNSTYELLEKSIVEELTYLLERDFLKDHNLKLKRKYARGGDGWTRMERKNGKNKPRSVGENLFKAAIIQGVDRCHVKKSHPVHEIWCSNTRKEHRALKRISIVNSEYKPDFKSIRLAKNYDLAWRTWDGILPNWFCQIKILTQGQGENFKKSIQALGDLFWGAVDREYLRSFHRHNAEFIFIWIEDKNAVNSKTRIRKNDIASNLKFDNDFGRMKFILSPGYHKDLLAGKSTESLGELRFEGYGSEKPWIDKRNAIVKPHGRTAIKEILAAGTNGTFFRMFNQPGKLFIPTSYRQFDTGNWLIYIHRLSPHITLRGADVEKSKFGGGKLFNWIP
tara:strand:+ start:100 stop:1110 length:1011 start_codon:yes stop_codon:yes gene_type:complete